MQLKLFLLAGLATAACGDRTPAGGGDGDGGIDAGSEPGVDGGGGFLPAACQAEPLSLPPDLPRQHPAACVASYTIREPDGTMVPNPDIDAVLAACPELAGAVLWIDDQNQDVALAAWSPAMRARLAALYQQMLANEPLTDVACPDPRGVDRVRLITWFNDPWFPMFLFYTEAQGIDLYLVAVAHALALEVSGDLPWSLHDFPREELEPLLSARSFVAPVTIPPNNGSGLIPDAKYAQPISHYNSMGFVCDPRIGSDFVRGRTGHAPADLVGAGPTETLARLTHFLAQSSAHGFPSSEPLATYQFTLGDRLHLGLDLNVTPATQGRLLIARIGCHSTAELLEDLARAVNIPLRNVASYGDAWTDGTEKFFRAVTHRGLAYAWSRPDQLRILPHADFVNATAYWPVFRAGFDGDALFRHIWRTPACYAAMGMQVDETMPIVPILPTNSRGSFEYYPDFGRVVAVLGPGEARGYLRTEACSWDVVRGYCVDPAGGPDAFARNNPYGGYELWSDAATRQRAFEVAAECVAARPGGCTSVPVSYLPREATNWLP